MSQRLSGKEENLFQRLTRKFGSESEIIPIQHSLHSEPHFLKRLIVERKRAERSNRPLLVMILDLAQLQNVEDITSDIGSALLSTVRETDVCGHLKQGSLLGVILTEIELGMQEAAKRTVELKVRERLHAILDDSVISRIPISFMTFSESDADKGVGDLRFYPEASFSVGGGVELAKRALDVVGTVLALTLFSPFFVVVPIMIKLTSKGPVFFRQQRVGLNGCRFELLKFRSMYLGNDDVIHRRYVENLIRQKQSPTQKVYKIQGDPRVTWLGRYLRKYSIDEMPQLLNVLKGDMSLVGPRPPIVYEVESYFTWQRNRLIGRKPGITGMWQVTGRSSTTFDEMVRIDLRYIRGWSLLTDVKILLQTPRAVLRCKGAY